MVYQGFADMDAKSREKECRVEGLGLVSQGARVKLKQGSKVNSGKVNTSPWMWPKAETPRGRP